MGFHNGSDDGQFEPGVVAVGGLFESKKTAQSDRPIVNTGNNHKSAFFLWLVSSKFRLSSQGCNRCTRLTSRIPDADCA